MTTLDERLQLLREISIGLGKRRHMFGHAQPRPMTNDRMFLREFFDKRLPQRLR
jgi:hypothetical protein